MKNLINNQKTYIKELHTKKGRQEHQAFLIEGEKLVAEAQKSGVAFEYIIATNEVKEIANDFGRTSKCEVYFVASSIMESLSTFSTPPGIIAIAKIPNKHTHTISPRVLMLDGISDPGNLGTLLRSAEWFGFTTVYLSSHCVELYNPKVVAATMGSLFRLDIYPNSDLVVTAQELAQQGFAIVATLMNGDHQLPNVKKIALVIGSESHGISVEVLEVTTHSFTIPGGGGAESLNASVAGSIVMSKVAGI